jgi:glycosyltransferase involved in cell wall biosynthesis
MKILVVSAFEAASRFAHASNTIKMAQGFARLGHEVGIVCFNSPSGRVPVDTLAEIYGLTESMQWIQLPRRILNHNFDVHWQFGRMAFLAARWFKPDMAYTRSYIFPCFSSRAGIPTAVECHAHVGEKSDVFLRMVKASLLPSFRAWVTISNVLAEYYCSLGAPGEKIAVFPDAVDLHLFRRPAVLPESPYRSSGTHVVYSGHLYEYKGIFTILDAAQLLPHVHFELVGGLPDDIARYKAEVDARALRNVTLHGMQPQTALPSYLWHADALLLTHTIHHPSAAWTSPLKLGEYLASGVPVVVSDIPALRNWVSEDDVEFIAPDDGGRLAEGIMKILNDPARSHQLTKNALAKSETLSYENRAQAVLSFAQVERA